MPTPNLNVITSVVPGILDQRQLSGAAAQVIYTVPTSTAMQPSPLLLTNAGSGAAIISVYVKRSGGTARRVVSRYSLAVDETVIVDELAATWLGEGDSVLVDCDTAAAVDSTLSGLVFG